MSGLNFWRNCHNPRGQRFFVHFAVGPDGDSRKPPGVKNPVPAIVSAAGLRLPSRVDAWNRGRNELTSMAVSVRQTLAEAFCWRR
ncbi:hypothetical protein Oter_3683 [Opitutus terrae PB90-1]|uniref:Uncharacterized protein n=1 Tax=Opitutus terrae (strain DSM 11246 / JCM 15787 / PB90-1) TaxID=452637 RepID=B1ZXG5_OPITP|nr:hypothetical protein Oter_3683 [Opitutus terrae PB90-1]